MSSENETNSSGSTGSNNSTAHTKLKCGEILIPKPNNILTDIYGVITSWDFSKQLKSYFKSNLSDYLSRNWTQKVVVLIVTKLREQTLIDRSSGLEIPLIEESDKSEEVVRESVVANVLWQIDHQNKSSQKQLDTLYNQLWSDAYKSGRLKTHTFADVRPTLNHWRFHQFVKIYSYASGPQEGQKLFLSSSADGDLTTLFANHINSSGGYKYDSNKFRVVRSALRESNPKNILYLTDEPKKARAAIEAGLRAVVILRPGSAQYSEEDLRDLTFVKSLQDIKFKDIPGESGPCC